MMNEPGSAMNNVRFLLTSLAEAWVRDDREAAEVLVMDLAEPLLQLTGDPQFSAAFDKHFSQIFVRIAGVSGMEELCRQLAPACAWCMLCALCDPEDDFPFPPPPLR